MVSSYDEILNQKSLHFQDRLKDLKDLRKQLYSAAEYFESSYNETTVVGHIDLIESSKDYVVNALVSTVDHLGSVADKLNSFLDEKTDEFSATSISLSRIQQRVNTFRGLVDLRGISQQSMMVVEAPKHNKHYIVPSSETSLIIACPQYDAHKHKQEYNNPFTKSFQQDGTKPVVPLLRNKDPVNFPFRKFLSSREQAGPRSVSPLHFSLKRSGSVASTSISPSPSLFKRSPSVPQRAIRKFSVETTSRETETYSKRSSKQLFKALLDGNFFKRD